MHRPKVLFILKKKKLYDETEYAKTIHSGLFNSAHFVSEMLNDSGIESNCVQVNDNNDIDREVSKYRPDVAIIEAIWVVPEKFEVLHRLHPDVTWIVRLHSEIPFIANEGVALEWIYRYSALSEACNLKIAPNTRKMFNDLSELGINNLVFLPNYYPVRTDDQDRLFENKGYINVGCFGAIRPMKNQLIQAVAAIEFGNDLGMPIRFHINSERIERGDTVIKNIRALFANQTEHELVEHPWYDHRDFIKLIRKMDVGLQVSLNETFNIVAADFVSAGVPVVGSNEIRWLNFLYKADPTDSSDIVKKLKFAYFTKKYNIQGLNRFNLKKIASQARRIWINYLRCNH